MRINIITIKTIVHNLPSVVAIYTSPYPIVPRVTFSILYMYYNEIEYFKKCISLKTI